MIILAAAPTPPPAPPLEVIVNLPAPEPFPTPVVHVPALDPWEWSLDSLLALFGVVSSTLVAAAAVGVSIYFTVRERNERKARESRETEQTEREARAGVGRTMLRYVTGQMTSNLPPARSRNSYTAVQEATAASGLDLDEMEQWLVDSASAVREWWQNAYPTGDANAPKSSGAVLAYLSAESGVRSPIVEWMTTGAAEFVRVPYPDDVPK